MSEPGESLEDTVHREIREEVGVAVTDGAFRLLLGPDRLLLIPLPDEPAFTVALRLDPLGLAGSKHHPELDPGAYGFDDADNRLTDASGRVPGTGTALLRLLLATVTNVFFLAGLLWRLFDSDNKTLYDRLCHTRLTSETVPQR